MCVCLWVSGCGLVCVLCECVDGWVFECVCGGVGGWVWLGVYVWLCV